jgi:hypothetical protein
VAADLIDRRLLSFVLYFFVYELPRVAARLAPAVSGDRTLQDIQEEWL